MSIEKYILTLKTDSADLEKLHYFLKDIRERLSVVSQSNREGGHHEHHRPWQSYRNEIGRMEG